ncbi:sensor domain-containing diguanylate cyclase [Sulfurimonas marina]|uniref:diguanylate cyclase n=1 Tax=Sulfurimonas marina TaxID=2590551 RepID=A0A7M1AZA7_9BACT|nr:diguanylate cyclase [Sulfurimonas marina]QOP41702.1 GGDEF domain-containing protein [Sulfurimonas marina]
MRVLILLFFFFISLSAQISFINEKDCYKDFEIEYFYDQSNTLEVTDLQEKEFKKTTNNFTFGYLDGTTWFKIVLENNSSQEEFLLTFSEVLWKSFNLYQYKNNKWHVDKNGLDIPLNQRSFKSVYPIFRLHIPSGTTQTIYIQGETIAGQLGEFQLCSQEHYFSESTFEALDIYLIFAFSLLSIFILNLYSFFLTKERVYLYYVAYTFVFIIFSAMQSGFYLLFGFNGWNEGLHVVGTFVLVTLIMFSDTFLQLKEHLQIVHKFFQFCIGLFLLFALLIWNNVPYTTLVFNIFSIFFFATLFYATIQTYRRGYVGAKYYLIALIIYSAMMTLMVLTFNAFLEYNFLNRHLFVLGSFIEIIFFTLILANKYRTISQEKIKIQAELLVEKNKNEEELKLAVEERTQELEDAKKELERLVVTDYLTKAKNIRAYREKIVGLLSLYERYKTPFSMIIFDIDDFKAINDTYGHRMGDIVLIELTKLIQRNIRKNDYFFRIGGEEFILLLENTGLDKAEKFAQNLLVMVSNKLSVIKDHQITVSIGLTEVEPNDTEDSIYKRADTFLYKSKNNGKNQVSFE